MQLPWLNRTALVLITFSNRFDVRAGHQYPFIVQRPLGTTDLRPQDVFSGIDKNADDYVEIEFNGSYLAREDITPCQSGCCWTGNGVEDGCQPTNAFNVSSQFVPSSRFGEFLLHDICCIRSIFSICGILPVYSTLRTHAVFCVHNIFEIQFYFCGVFS